MIITGTGIFGWAGEERRSDRYGAFALDRTGYDNNGECPQAGWSEHPSALTGLQCHITVEVLETRESGHIGDFFRGIFPEKPEVGEIIDLGTGTLFVERDRMEWAVGGLGVGLRPSDGRENDWLDPRKLYRLHDQTVRVTITPTETET